LAQGFSSTGGSPGGHRPLIEPGGERLGRARAEGLLHGPARLAALDAGEALRLDFRPTLRVDGVAPLERLDPRLLHGMAPEKAVELGRVAPGVAEVVGAERAGGDVGDDGIHPARQPDEEALGSALERGGGAVGWPGQAEAAAGGGDRGGGRDGDDGGHGRIHPGWGVGRRIRRTRGVTG